MVNKYALPSSVGISSLECWLSTGPTPSVIDPWMGSPASLVTLPSFSLLFLGITSSNKRAAHGADLLVVGSRARTAALTITVELSWPRMLVKQEETMVSGVFLSQSS